MVEKGKIVKKLFKNRFTGRNIDNINLASTVPKFTNMSAKWRERD